MERPEMTMVPTDRLVLNPGNPNEMDDRTFNALVESIREEGWLEPIQVVPIEGDQFAIVGGHHRAEAARHLELEEVPAVVLDPETFDQDRRDWNMVKLNILRGKLNPVKFTQMYERMAKKYDKEVLKNLMGFTTEDAFQRLYRQVTSSLPPELASALEEVKDEIKTIDDLSLVLNRLFSEFGESLPSNMMVFSWAGREVLWVRCDDHLWQLAKGLADDVLAEKGDMAEALAEAIEVHQQARLLPAGT